MLTYNLSKRGKTPIYEYLYKCIRDDILMGRIKAGDKLPSKRSFAKHLGVSVITVENDGEKYGAAFDEEGEKGVGLGSTMERLKRMCGGEMEIAQREGGGTIVTIRIPDRGSCG